MLINRLLLIALVICNISCLSQSLPTIILPSPTASSFAKYGEIPVDYYTGTPKINIPIYSSKSGEIPLNISLSYHASGVKVEEEASWVGLGWSLNAGGVITRTVKDLPDELSDQSQPFGPCTSDREPDIYYFNFDGYKGKFVIDIATKKIRIIDQQDLKINQLLPIGTGFELTTPNGFIYTFNYQEIQRYSLSTESYSTDPIDYPSSWYLTKIISPIGNQIILNYETASSFDCVHLTTSYHYEKPTKYWMKGINVDGNEVSSSYFAETGTKADCSKFVDFDYDLIDNEGSISGSYVKTQSVYLRSIEWNLGYLEFNRDDREDILSPTKDLLSKKLNSIVLYNKILNNKNKLKSFIFNYDYSVPIVYLNPGTDIKRLRLLSFTESSSNDLLKLATVFTYESTILPSKYSLDIDHWGFYNGPVNNSTLIPELGANREPNSKYLIANSLIKIKYPTGGTTEFEFEPNDYSNKGSDFTIGGGIRIKRIINSDGRNSFFKKFEYKKQGINNDISSGKLIYPLRYSIDRVKANFVKTCTGTQLVSSPNGPYNKTVNIQILYSSYFTTYFQQSLSPLSLNHGSSVCYDKVTVYEDDNGLNGKTVYEYKNNESPASTYTFTPSEAPNDNGQLIKQTIYSYDKISKIYIPAEIQENTFESINPYSINYFEENPIITQGRCNSNSYNLRSYFSYWNRLIKTKTIIYSQNDHILANPLASETNYEYKYNGPDPVNRLLHFEKITKSNGDLLQYEYKYPEDFTNSYYLYGNMVEKNVISPIIEKITSKNGVIINQERNYFDDNWFNDEYKFALEHVEIKLKFSNYQPVIHFHNYNQYGSVLLQSKEKDVLESYQWGYNDQYPVVKIINAENSIGTYSKRIIGSNSQTVTWDPGRFYLQEIKFLQAMSGDVVFNCNFSEFPGNASVVFTYTLKGPFQVYGTLCIAGPGGNCSNQSTITLKDLPPGHYDLWVYVNSDFSIGSSFTCTYQGLINLPGDTHLKEFFYNGFEEELASDLPPFAGMKCFVGNYTVPFIIPNNRKYIIDYWALNSGVWTFKTKPYRNNMVLSDGEAFDEVRVFPSDANINTFTYIPLIGITSEEDQRGKTTLYDYDALGRLIIVRDQNRNILKRYCYNYYNQQSPCELNTTPNWLSTGITQCKPCDQNNNYTSGIAQHQEKDNNPYSSTYGTLRWVDDGPSSACTPQPYWQNSGVGLRCQIVNGSYTGFQEQEQIDNNPCSPTANKIQWVVAGINCINCPKAANWQPTGNYQCLKDANNVNTGYQQREEMDIEGCSLTSGQTRWVANGYNPGTCPISCNTSTCSGTGNKCINGVCETGCRINTSSVYMKINNPAGDPPQIWVWRCTYHYRWSDGSISGDYTEDNSTSCPLQNSCSGGSVQ